MGDQSFQLRRHSIDQSSSVYRSVSISNPSVYIPEAGSNGRSPLVQAEVVPQAFSFGPFRIVPRARLLVRDGSRTRVGSRAFDLLCVLVSCPGEVVRKSELMARVWPDLTVEESSLRFHIAQLRRTLGDGREGKRHITNVAGRATASLREWIARHLRTFSTSTVEEICHASGSMLVAAGGSCARHEGQVPLQASVEFVHTYNAQAHELVDAITATVSLAPAGLNWLRAEPPDLEEVRQALNDIASDGKRAAEIVVRLRALMKGGS
jgi:hypothetical protein